MLFALTGCLTTFKSASDPGGPAGDEKFSSGLKQLAKKGDTTALNELAKNDPDSPAGKDARTLLSIYKAQDKKIRSLQKENKKLKADLEKMNQINLEMEKRSR